MSLSRHYFPLKAEVVPLESGGRWFDPDPGHRYLRRDAAVWAYWLPSSSTDTFPPVDPTWGSTAGPGSAAAMYDVRRRVHQLVSVIRCHERVRSL